MKSVPYEELRDMLASFKREVLHLEMRDAYSTEAEIPHLRKWLSGEPDDPSWLKPWFDKVRAGTAAGKSFKRA
jgi:hypothetical protein